MTTTAEHPATIAPETDILAARAEVKAPESADAVHAPAATDIAVPEPAEITAAKHEQPALMPTEPHAPKLPVAALAPDVIVPANDVDLMVDKETTVKAAEKHVADYVGGHIDPRFTEGLMLELKEHAGHGKEGLKLCFHGPKLEFNQVLMGQQVIAALKTHPSFAPLFEHKETTPHLPHGPDGGDANMSHVLISGLSVEHYNRLLHELSNGMNVAAEPVTAASVSAAPVTAPIPAPITANDNIEAANDVPHPSIAIPAETNDRVVELQKAASK